MNTYSHDSKWFKEDKDYWWMSIFKVRNSIHLGLYILIRSVVWQTLLINLLLLWIQKNHQLWKPLGVSFLVPSRNETHVWINLLIEIRLTINFIISDFYRTLSYLSPRWTLYAIFFIYYDFIDVFTPCTTVHCFYHVCMNVCDSWVFQDSFVTIKLLSTDL